MLGDENGFDLPIVLNFPPFPPLPPPLPFPLLFPVVPEVPLLKGLALIRSWIFFSTISSNVSLLFFSIPVLLAVTLNRTCSFYIHVSNTSWYKEQ